MNKQHNKPTGKIGNVLKLGSSGTAKMEVFKFPDTKDQIEEKIAKLFLDLIKTNNISELRGLSLKRNHEYDLDFFLVSNDKKYLLELTEFTPPGDMQGGYQKLAYSHNIGKHAQKIIDLIQKNLINILLSQLK